MITYTEKGSGLHRAITQAGHSLVHHDGIWIASDESAVQAIIDAYPASATAAPIIVEVKLHARERILARYPDWRQANMTARSVELTETLATGGVLTADEQAEVAAMKAAWAWIKSVRVKSGEHEAAINALVDLSDFSGILTYDWRSGWPE